MSLTKHPHRNRHHHKRPQESSFDEGVQRQPPISSESLFTIDRKGDPQYSRYGSIDKYKVPRYHTAGYGRLIGLDRRYKIVSTSASERVLDNEAIDWGNKGSTWPSLFKRQAPESTISLLKREASSRDKFTEQQSYISLGRKRRRLLKEQAEGDHDGAETRFDHSDDVVSESDFISSSSSEGEAISQDRPSHHDAFERFKNHPDNKKFLELKKRTEDEPEDTTSWFDLIQHQETYFMLSIGQENSMVSASQQGTIIDMRIHLYEKAMSSVKDSHAREKLCLGLVKEGSKVWDMNKQLKEWEKILRDTKSLRLWHEFLNFRQTNTITFSYEGCLDTYLNVWKMISNINDGDRKQQDLSHTYLVLRLTSFIFESGQAERAIAIWQALLETNFLAPTDGMSSMTPFESFWESECARIGENGARGWCSGVEQDIPSRTDRPLDDLNKKSLFADWANAEAQRSIDDLMPARTLDDTVEDDPFRVILFSDVKDFIFEVNTDESKFLLLQAFLKFCNLPPIYDSTTRCRDWWSDPFLCSFDPDINAGKVTDTSTLFAAPESPLYIWNVSKSSNKGLVDFAARVLIQLVERFPSNDQLAEYTIALQLQRDPKTARKSAKAMLKRSPDSLLLYNAFALVEERSGRPEVADNVWSTALSMANALGPVAHQHKAILWHSWVWKLLEQQRYAHVRSLLAEVIPAEQADITAELFYKASQSTTISSGQQLKAEAYLNHQISTSRDRDDGRIVDYANLYAILQYLKPGTELVDSMGIYSLLKGISSRHTLERLYQSQAKSIHLHMHFVRSGYQPGELVRILETPFKQFPDNTVVSSLHEKLLRQAGIIDRLRMLERDGEISINSMIPHLQSIGREISRPLYSGSTKNTVRQAFVKATATDSLARHCPIVWKRWIEWEVSLISSESGDTEKHVKDVYLSALRACPWYKDLYLAGFGEDYLSKAIGYRELEQVYRSMTERGLRLRHDITDMLDDAAES